MSTSPYSQITTINSGGILIPTTFSKRLAKTPTLIPNADYFALHEIMPNGGGSNYAKARIANLNVTTSPVPPGAQGMPPQVLNISQTSCQVQMYIITCFIDVMAQMQSQIDLGEAAKEKIYVALCLSEDTLMIDCLVSATMFVEASGGNTDYPSTPTFSFYAGMAALLQYYSAEKVWGIIEGEMEIGTQPVGSSFWNLVNTLLAPTFQGNSQFIRVEQYPSAPAWCAQTELGQMGYFRVFHNPSIPSATAVSANGNTVFICPFGGADAYLQVHQEGANKFLYEAGPAYSGYSMLQSAYTGQTALGQMIFEPTWVGCVLMTGGTVLTA